MTEELKGDQPESSQKAMASNKLAENGILRSWYDEYEK